MMRLVKTISAAFLANALSSACERDKGSILEETVEYTILNTDTLRHSIGFFGDEEGASIHSQATHYLISELVGDYNSGERICQFVADPAYLGNDNVVLRSARGSNGESPNKDIIITTIEITVE